MNTEQQHFNANTKESSLTIPKIQNILKLQQLFHNQFLTVELLHQLISLYTACIQSLDQAQKQFRIYFLQKIQFVLSRTQIQNMLTSVNKSQANNIQNNKIVDNLRQTLRTTQRNQTQLHAKLKMQMPQSSKICKKRLYNYDGDNPDQKKKKIDIQIQLMNEMQKNMKTITTQVQNANIKHNISNKMITEITSQQNWELQERLQARKNRGKQKKLRKKSADNKKKVLNDEQNQNQNEQDQKINKAELIQAQSKIHDALVRITIRNTQRRFQEEQDVKKEQKRQQTFKGRVKHLNRQQSSQDQ